MHPDVTVIVPTYNVERYIDKCLNMLLKQTNENFVVFAIDDGSTDDSNKIIKKYSKKDPRIKLMVKSNGGYGSVLQYAIQRIKTKYFLVCDSDDWLDKSALEVLYKNAEKNNTDITIGDFYNVYTDDIDISYSEHTFSKELNIQPRRVYTSNKQIQKMSLGIVSPHAKLYKTNIAKNIIFPKHISFTDTILYLDSLVQAKRVVYIDKPLAYYLRDRPGNSSTDKRPKIIADYIVMWNSLFTQLKSNDNITSFMWFKLYDLLYYILHQYKTIIGTSNSIYYDQICKMLIKMQKYRSRINKDLPKSKSSNYRILMFGLLNQHFYRLFIRLLLLKKERQ